MSIEYRDHLEIDLRSALCALIIMILISISDPVSRHACHAEFVTPTLTPSCVTLRARYSRERLNIKMIHSDQRMLIYLIMMTDAGRPNILILDR